MLKSCGSSSKGAQDLQCVIRLINAIRTFTMNGTKKKKKNSFQVNLLKYIASEKFMNWKLFVLGKGF